MSAAPAAGSTREEARLRKRARSYLWGLAVSVGVASYVIWSELNAQSVRLVVSGADYAYSLGTLFGPNPVASWSGWSELAGNTGTSPSDLLFRRIITTQFFIDLLLIVCYTAVFLGLARFGFRRVRSSTGLRGEESRRRAMIMAVVPGFMDLVENCLASAMLRPVHPPVWVLAGVTLVKWISFGVVLLMIAARFVPRAKPPSTTAGEGQRIRRWPRPIFMAVGRIRRALVHHRFSVALLIPLVVLGVLRGHPVLDQLPDVLRRWPADGSRGWLHLGFGLAMIAVAAGFSAWLSSMRTGYAFRLAGVDPQPGGPTPAEADAAAAAVPGGTGDTSVPAPDESGATPAPDESGAMPADETNATDGPGSSTASQPGPAPTPEVSWLNIWLVGPAVALSAALLALPLLEPDPDRWRLLAFCAVPLTIFTASLGLRRHWQREPHRNRPDEPMDFNVVEVRAIAFTGNALAIGVSVVGALGIFRALTSPVLLYGTGWASEPIVVGLLMVAALAIVVPWMLGWAIGRSPLRQTGVVARLRRLGSQPRARHRPYWVALFVVIAGIVLVATFPSISHVIGVSATAVLTIGLLVAIPATMGLIVQERPTAELFRFLGFRRSPLITVLVLTIISVGLFSNNSTIHPVASSRVENADVTRPPLSAVVPTWAKNSSCRVRLQLSENKPGTPDRYARPMLLVAAEGGGIRAAYWTVKGLDTMGRTDGKPNCLSSAAVMSAGASGGSVGLTVARFSGTRNAPSTERALGSVLTMAEPSTLGDAVVGTFLRDVWYGATGVPLPRGGDASWRAWSDRAALIEQGWATSGDWYQKDFLREPEAGQSPVTGHLVLNSSSASDRCRVWVSQLDLPRSAGGGQRSCEDEGSPGPRTIDAFAAYGPATNNSAADCLSKVSAVTAALLTARFPYVTPSGVVEQCPADPDRTSRPAAYWPQAQLIDGGYLENSGLATITDLAPQLLAQVRRHNAAALADPSGNIDQIVPIVVYLTNDDGIPLTPPDQAGVQSELLVPIATLLGGTRALSQPDALLQRAQGLLHPESFCPSLPTDPAKAGSMPDVPHACADAANAFPRRVIVIDRGSRPEVSAPLGWVMSKSSQDGLDHAMSAQQNLRCVTDGGDVPICRRGYGSLGDLLHYVTAAR